LTSIADLPTSRAPPRNLISIVSSLAANSQAHTYDRRYKLIGRWV